MNIQEERLEAKGYLLADTPAAAGLYQPLVERDGVVYMAGAIPVAGGALTSVGKVPSVVTVEDAQKAAELCAANLLRVFVRDCGPLDRIARVLKVTGFVNSESDFTDPHLVINGASQLVIDVLGDPGKHARSAVGVATLPLGVSVEVEMIIAVK